MSSIQKRTFPHKWKKYIIKINNFINYDLYGFKKKKKKKDGGKITASYKSIYHIKHPSINLIKQCMDNYCETNPIILNITVNISFEYTNDTSICTIKVLFNECVIYTVLHNTPKHTYNDFTGFINDCFVDYNLDLFQ